MIYQLLTWGSYTHETQSNERISKYFDIAIFSLLVIERLQFLNDCVFCCFFYTHVQYSFVLNTKRYNKVKQKAGGIFASSSLTNHLEKVHLCI